SSFPLASLSFFFVIILRPPTSTLFPYTTLFRSSGIRLSFRRYRFHRYRVQPISSPVFVEAAFRRTFAFLWASESPPKCGFHEYRSEEHTSELQSLTNLVCRLLLEKKKNKDKLIH